MSKSNMCDSCWTCDITKCQFVKERQITSEEICQARYVMRKAFDQDPMFLNGYIANVAMLMYDKCGITDVDKRNELAKDVLKLIFG